MRHSPGLIVLSLVLSVYATLGYGQASSQGQWSALETWPTRAVHTTVLPDGRVFFVSYYDESLQPNIWDPVTDTFTATAGNSYALFCAGHTGMADGRIFIAGGHIADYTGYPHAVIYDPSNDSFTQVPDMNEGRWYPTTTVLGNGDILVTSGDVNGNSTVDPTPQVFQVSSGTWRDLTTAQLMQELYPVMFVAPNGQVVYTGPDTLTRSLDTTGTGAWTDLATRAYTGWRDYGPGVMYESGQVLEVGGGDPPTPTAEIIDLTASTPAWNFTGNMNFPRRQHNAVVLPDGKVLIVGGSSGGGFDDDTNPVLPTETWDPATGQFTQMASIAVYRGYHSTAVLLPDGRVLSAGGNVGGANAQVYSPPYLFNGARPSISSAPTSVGYGQTVFIGTPDAGNITKVAWIRNASTTHTFDEGGRYMHLGFTKTSGGLNITMPANGNLAPPGYYMLFILNGSGVPSVAKVIQITQGGGNTGNLSGTVTNTSGAPIAGASVTSGSISARSAGDGSYTLLDVPAGSSTITASLSGYNSASTQVTVVAGQNAVPALQLAPINPGAITGSVVDSGAHPITGAAVRGDGLTVMTNSSGSYTLNNVPAGSVTLTASAAEFQQATETVTVTAGNTTAAPAMTLASNLGNVTGTVTDTSNNAIARATVSFGGGSTTTDANGVYNFTNLPAGTIQLVATAQGFLRATQNVVVTGGSTTTANFSLPAAAAGTVTGTVTNISTGETLSNSTVTWNGTSVTTDANGVYTLNNVAGGTQTLSAVHTGYLQRSGTVNVNGGTSTLNFQLSTAGILNVHVVSSSGTAVSGASVTLTGGVISTTQTGATDSTGTYSSSWIAIGNYTVTSGTLSTTATVNTGQTTDVTLTQTSGGGGVFATASVTISGSLASMPPTATANTGMASFVTADGNPHVFYVGNNQHVIQLSWTSTGGWQPRDMTAVAGGSTVGTGSALTSTQVSGVLNIFYIDSNKHVNSIHSGNGIIWANYDLTAAAGGPQADLASPISAFGPAADANLHLFYVAGGHVNRMVWPTAGGFLNQDLTSMIGGPSVGSGSGLTSMTLNGAINAFYVDVNRHVNSLQAGSGGAWTNNDLTTAASGPLADAGSPISAFGPVIDGNMHMFYVAGGHVNRMVWPTAGGVLNQDLTSLTGGPSVGAGSRLSSMGVSGGLNTFYIDANRHVNSLHSGGGGWGNYDLTAAAGSGQADLGSQLTSLGPSGDAVLHLFYPASSHVDRLVWPTSGSFHNEDLNANPVSDSGTVSLTIGSFTATACYGASTNSACTGQPANNTAAQVASALAQAINVSSSPATATVNGAVLTLTWKVSGNVTTAVGALATTHDQPSVFASPSFTSPATNFSGGQ
ncbi:MAG TPA: carboxypeptidase regulatory-like domain-containing protein [Candidatus Angelobacter sp.]